MFANTWTISGSNSGTVTGLGAGSLNIEAIGNAIDDKAFVIGNTGSIASIDGIYRWRE